MVRDLTQGKPLSLIVSFCGPLIIGNLFQQFYNLVDMIVVGQYVGVGAVAAVGATGSLGFLVLGFVLGMCSGLCIPISNSFGAGDYSAMRRYVFNAVYVAAAMGVLVTSLTVIFCPQILQLMKTPADIYADSKMYITIIFSGIPATILYNILSGILRALGDSKTPLYFLIIAALLNVALDLTFVLALNAGVMGVAVATVISQAVSGILCLIYIIKKFPILRPEKDKDEVRFKSNTCLRLLGTALPMALQFSITALGALVLQSAVNTLGSGTVAAVTASGKVSMLVTQPMETLGITMATYCSQNLGAGKISRIREGVLKSSILAAGYCVVALLIIRYAGVYISHLFINSKETEIFDMIKQFTRINSYFYIFLSMVFIYRNALQGMGHGVIAMAAGLFEMVARMAMAFIFVIPYGFIAVCFAHPAAWIAADILLFPVYFITMRSMKKKFPEVAEPEMQTVENSQ